MRVSWACLLGLVWSDAPNVDAGNIPRTAFLVVFERYKTKVVDAYAGAGHTSTFVLVKAIHFDGAPYSDQEAAALNETIYRTLAPAAALVTNRDPTTARFGQETSAAAIDCIFPRRGVGLFSKGYEGPVINKDDFTIGLHRKRFTYWWGAMQLAWELVADHEAATGRPFDRAIFIRAGINLAERFPPHDRLPTEFYTAINPPDSFWVMSRRVAAVALTMASRVVDCTRTGDCCVQMHPCSFRWSWWIPCILSRETGIAPVVLPMEGFVSIHSEAPKTTPTYTCFPWNATENPEQYKKCASPLFNLTAR